jgi:hypothetical protein
MAFFKAGILSPALILLLQFVPIIVAIGGFEIGCVCGRICYTCTYTARFIFPIWIIFRSIPSGRILKRNTRQAWAIIERPITDTRYAVGDYHARQAWTTSERIRTNRSDAVADFHARQTIAIIERIRTDRSDTIADFHARQAWALIERIITDRSDAVADFHARQAFAIIERSIQNISTRYRYHF